MIGQHREQAPVHGRADRRQDPRETVEIAPAYRAPPRARLLDWFCNRRTRTTVSLASVEAETHRDREAGVFYGLW